MSSTDSAASSSVIFSAMPNYSSTSVLAPSSWADDNNDYFDCPTADTVRRALRGMESELVDLVLKNSLAGAWMDWLRVPLECATTTGRLGAVKRLLAAGVETSIPPRRPSPGPLLHSAATNGNAGVVCELLKAGADVHEVDKTCSDRTALHFAAASGAEDAVLELVRAGAKVEAADSRGWTPLHVAAKVGHRAVVVFLLLKGSQTLRTALPEGDTALHLAASENHAGVIEDLVTLGNACVACPNSNGQTGTWHIGVDCVWGAHAKCERGGHRLPHVTVCHSFGFGRQLCDPCACLSVTTFQRLVDSCTSHFVPP